MNVIWLSASRPDPEWERARELLLTHEQVITDSWDDPRVQNILTRGPGTVYAFEREDRPSPLPKAVVIVDHHSPGDPGYGEPPEHYWSASSLGQTWRALVGLGLIKPGARLPRDYALAAASDHCPRDAYQGRCPGIDPEELMRWRIAVRAEFQGREPEDIQADVVRAMDVIQSAPELHIGASVRVRDLRKMGWVPEAPEAALRLGTAILGAHIDRHSGRKKINLLAATPEQVRVFMQQWGGARLHDLYGDPARGFAGGYRRTKQ